MASVTLNEILSGLKNLGIAEGDIVTSSFKPFKFWVC